MLRVASVVNQGKLEEWFMDSVLRTRYRQSLTWSLLVQFALVAVWTTLNCSLTSGPFSAIGYLTSGKFLMVQLTLAAVLTILTLFHFKLSTVVPQTGCSYIETFRYFVNPGRVLQMGAFAAAGIIYGVMLRGHRTRDFCLNDSDFLTGSLGIYLGIACWINYNLHHSYWLRFESVALLKLPLIKTKIKDNFNSSFFESGRHLATFYASYAVLGFALKIVLNRLSDGLICDISNLGHISAIASPGNAWFNLSLAFLFNCAWQSALSITQIFLTEEYRFELDSNSEISLARMVQSKPNTILNSLAMLRFRNISSLANKRLALYSISLPGGHAYNWDTLSQSGLETLNRFASELSPNEMVKKIVIKQQQQRPVVTTPITSPGLRNIATVKSPLSPAVPLRNNSASPPPIEKKNLLPLFLSRHNQDQKLENLYKSCQTSVWVVEALANSVVASIAEDKHGVVQWTMPSILGAFLDLQTCLERPQHKMVAATRRGGANNKNRAARDRCCGWQFQNSLRTALKCAVYRIVDTFWEHLKEKDYTEEQWQRLNRFKEFGE